MSYSQDIQAIDVYIKGAPLNTEDAAEVHDEWVAWHNGLGWWVTEEDYDRARNIRNRFNLANAMTNAERVHVQNVIQSGWTTEEMAGGTSRALSDGMYREPLISSTTKNLLAVTAVVGFAGWVALKLSPIRQAVARFL